MQVSYRRKGHNPEYIKILESLQKEQNDVFWEMNQSGVEIDRREQMTPYVIKFLHNNQITLIGYSETDLAKKLVDDLIGFSVLTEPLADPTVEGISINSWEDIRVVFRDGTSIKTDGFQTPQQAIDIVRRLLLESKVTMDDAVPMAEASMGDNIRITAVQTPIVSKDVGVSCYIRKLNRRMFSLDEYVQNDFAAREEIELLSTALKRGVSILLVGKVNTGKTTFLAHLLSSLPSSMQIATIESGAREFNLIKRDAQNQVCNNVMHLLTRHSTNANQDVTQEKLVEKVLRLNADVISVAEMRNEEAYAAQEASLVGTPIISTAHAGSPRQAHKRVADLCRKRFPVDPQTALIQACEAFPLVAFIHMLPDHRRRIMNLSECLVKDNTPIYRTLYEYEIDSNTFQNGKSVIKGHHKKVNTVSSELCAHMKMYGITEDEIQTLLKRDTKTITKKEVVKEALKFIYNESEGENDRDD